LAHTFKDIMDVGEHSRYTLALAYKKTLSR